MAQHQRRLRILSAGVDSGEILCFSFGPGAGVKILWKTAPGITFHFQQQESVWFSYFWNFLSKNIAEFRLRRCYSQSEQESDSEIWNFFWSGFNNFGRGADSESENVTTATSAFQNL